MVVVKIDCGFKTVAFELLFLVTLVGKISDLKLMPSCNETSVNAF